MEQRQILLLEKQAAGTADNVRGISPATLGIGEIKGLSEIASCVPIQTENRTISRQTHERCPAEVLTAGESKYLCLAQGVLFGYPQPVIGKSGTPREKGPFTADPGLPANLVNTRTSNAFEILRLGAQPGG